MTTPPQADLLQDKGKTDEQMLDDLRTVAARLDKPMSWKAYNAARDADTMLHSHSVMGRLDKTWGEACQAAGVEPGAQTRPSYTRRHGEDVLWDTVREYLADESRSGSYADFAEWCKQSASRPGAQTVRNALGRWSDVKVRAANQSRGYRVVEAL